MKSYLDGLKCPLCSKHINDYVQPEIPADPNIILVGEAPGYTERDKGRPFIGDSGQILRQLAAEAGARPILINSVNIWQDHKPETQDINTEREQHLIPLLNEYPDLPVVSLGKYAAQTMLGGKRAESVAGEAYWLYNRPVLFTFHPAYYLHAGRDTRITEHISVHIKSALRPLVEPKYFLDKMPGKWRFDEFVLDVETDGEEYPWYGSAITVVGVLPLGGIPHLYTRDFLADDARRSALIERLAQAKKVIGHGLMFDLVHTEYRGFRFPNAQFHDTWLYKKNLGEDELAYGLKFFAKREENAPPYEAKVHDYFRQKKWGEVPPEKLYPYNAGDLYFTEGLAVKQDGHPGLFDMDMDYMRYVKPMTFNGLNVSRSKLQRLGRSFRQEMEALAAQSIRKNKLGKDFNFASQPQVMSALHRLVDPRIIKSDKMALLKLRDKHPFVRDVLKLRKLKKAAEKTEELTDRIAKDGFIHSKMSVGGAETFRLSSSSPNIENFDSKMKDTVRSRYEGGKILAPDIGQLEYRLIAHRTEEPLLIDAFKKGEDIHRLMFTRLFDKEPKDDKERKIAKTGNYIEIYGGGVEKFLFNMRLSEIDIPEEEGRRIFKSLKGMYPAVDEFKKWLRSELKDGGWIYNIFGRQRYFHPSHFWPTKDDLYIDRNKERAAFEKMLREAFNWIFQSSGHDVTEIWTMESVDLIDDPKVLLVDEVHDEFVLDSPPKSVKSAESSIKFVSANLNTLIEQTFGVKLKVPLTADVPVSTWWK